MILLQKKQKVKNNRLLFWLLSITASVIVGSRGATRDTPIYWNIFSNIENYSLDSPLSFYRETGVEIGYGWYAYIISLITNNSMILFSIWSFFIFYFLSLISRLINVKYFPVFLIYISSGYFAIQQFMQIRQGLSIPIALYSILLLYNSRKISIKFLFLCFLSIFIHQLAAIIIILGIFPMFFILRERYFDYLSLRKFKYFSIFFIIISIFVSKYLLLDMLIYFSPRINDYVSTDFSESLSIFRLPNLKALGIYIIILFIFNDNMYKDRNLVLFFYLYSIGLAFKFGFIDFSILSGRMSGGFTFVEIFLLPIVINRFKGGGGVLITYIIISSIATYIYQVPNDFYESYFNELQ